MVSKLKPHFPGLSVLLLFQLALCFYNNQQVSPEILFHTRFNLWFDGDTPRNLDDMVTFLGRQERNAYHPFFTLFNAPMQMILENLIGLARANAFTLICLFQAGLWVTGIYLVFIKIGISKVDAFLFSLIGCVSSAALFWSPVLETHETASIFLVFLLLACLSLRESKINNALITFLSIGAYGMNLLCSALIVFFYWFRFPQARLKKFLRLSMLLVSAIAVIYLVEYFAGMAVRVPTFHRVSYEMIDMTFHLQGSSHLNSLLGVLSHAVVMPQIELHKMPFPMLRIQAAQLGSSGSWGQFATLIWLATLGLGIFYTFRKRAENQLNPSLSMLKYAFIFLTLFFTFYGREVFSYSFIWLPFVLFVASLSSQFPRFVTLRRLILAVFAIALFINNQNQYAFAASTLSDSRRNYSRLDNLGNRRDVKPTRQGLSIGKSPFPNPELILLDNNKLNLSFQGFSIQIFDPKLDKIVSFKNISSEEGGDAIYLQLENPLGTLYLKRMTEGIWFFAHSGADPASISLLIRPDEEVNGKIWYAGRFHETWEPIQFLIAQIDERWTIRKPIDTGPLPVAKFGEWNGDSATWTTKREVISPEGKGAALIEANGENLRLFLIDRLKERTWRR